MTDQNKSIVVLPFVNMSSDEEAEYFSDGITEEIINALTAIPDLRVIARTSAFSFKGKNLDVRNIANQLNVNTVLEGSVRRSVNRIRITVQFINAEDGSHFWSKNYDRDLDDIFTIQDEISLLIAEKIRENFGHFEVAEMLGTVSQQQYSTYDLYLKAKYELHKFNVEHVNRAISILEEVIKLDPNFAEAYVSLHYAYNILAAGGLAPVGESLNKGENYLNLALKLNPNLPEAYHSLGWHALNYHWDFNSAVNYLRKAIDLRPGYADAYNKLYITLELAGCHVLAEKQIQKALELDPLLPLNNYFSAYHNYIKGNFEVTNALFKRTFELDASFLVGYSINALASAHQNNCESIIKLAKNIPEIEGAHLERSQMMAIAYASRLDKNMAQPFIADLEKELNGKNRERIRFFLIYVETLLGNFEKAFKHISNGINYQEPLITLIKIDPLLKPLHSFKQWQEALNKIYSKCNNIEQLMIDKPNSNILLTPNEVEALSKKLDRLMRQKVLFTDAQLNLKTLAQHLQISSNKLSWLLNTYYQKNFKEYLNQYRLAEFKEKVVLPENQNLTLIALAYDCGFNSKTVFNTYFKKMEGVTPKTWLKNHVNR
ncbi:helix-turn-helix domain-containing protein [Psychroserpens sp. S379A]|uniref:helix-turn-helix domain-containing protein n=1 Tax=Psychroserpens sp. S379A TaxID=3415137 RepID=UPI003C7A20F9